MNARGLPKLVNKLVSDSFTRLAGSEGPKISAEYRFALTLGLRQQTYRHQALSPRYKAYKIRVGLDKRTLIATREYMSSIRWRQVTPMIWMVDVPSRRHRTAKINMRKLARIHEYGTRNGLIPARPIWAPTTRKFRLLAPMYAVKMEQRLHIIARGVLNRLLRS